MVGEATSVWGLRTAGEGLAPVYFRTAVAPWVTVSFLKELETMALEFMLGVGRTLSQ